jgi:hypothetical protein
MKTSYILLFGIAIGLLIVISLWGCQRVKPYSASGGFSIYEGMEEGEDEEEGFEEQDDEEAEGFDIMSNFLDSPSSLSCSSGLSNSGGGLCLSKDEQILLRTRGGNSSSGEAQIGN